MTENEKTYSGSCLCGAVSYKITGPLRPVVGCHCRQCQKTSGHYVAATQGRWGQLDLKRQDGLAWYRSSEVAGRGFCKECGSSLFWRRHGDDFVSIMAGTLDTPTKLVMSCHIFTDAKSDYYQIADGVPVATQEELRNLKPVPPDAFP